MDYSLLIGIERDEKQKIFGAGRKVSYLNFIENAGESGNSFKKSRYQDRIDMQSSSLNSNVSKE